MAKALDLQEQEQVEELKAFWKQYGNLITWAITLVLLAYAGWNAWGWYQRDQAIKASAMFDELDKAAAAGDAAKAALIFNDMKERYPRTTLAQQGGLLTATVQYDKGQSDAALATLTWLADNATEDEYRAIADLRLAGVLIDGKRFDAAIKALDEIRSPAFAALAADRRGDVLLAQGKKDEARAAYQAAYKGMDEKLDYRQLVQAKLTALGSAPAASAPGSAP